MSWDNTWMMGVRLHSDTESPVSYFCLVDGTVSGAGARSTAVSRAVRTSEIPARTDTGPDAPWARVQRLVHDPLGRISLSAPLPAEPSPATRAPLAPLTGEPS
ncbi:MULTISPECIES: hypothetical protein [unclassified Streptomyces]|uniref:hypothetical protein n=1 Tax=unclassified Streptomyces TaxID=2593676 RepID=UPI002E36FEE5|nr:MULTISPECIES: hypothetical protein [unclassified Streptomyces]